MPPSLQTLKTSLNFLHMRELRTICRKLSLPLLGKKGEIISQILHFLQTQEILPPSSIPNISLAKKGKIYPLHKDTLILKGSYKNDLPTRLFLKNLVGEYFHFTAAGQDWIQDRWHKGAPPTYQEFADFWKSDYESRKIHPSAPKKEWAYINFTRDFLQKNPGTPQKTLQAHWEKERESHVQNSLDSLQKILGKPITLKK